MGAARASTIDLGPLQALQRNLRKGGWKLTVAVHEGSAIIATWPGFHDRLSASRSTSARPPSPRICATSRAARSLASSGMMNPQIRFGEDLMTRVSYAMMNPGGDAEMTAAVRRALDALLGELCAEAEVEPGTSWSWCSSATRSCTTCCWASTRSSWAARRSRWRPTARSSCARPSSGSSGKRRRARVYILPCIAGHVGADCAGVVLAETPYLKDEMTLLVDVGTNAEIVLGNRERLLACSSPTGPAFEGAQISSGQRAAPGAIERVRIDRETLEPRFKVIGCDLWSDEPGFAAATRATGVTGICGSGIIEALAELYLAGVITADGVIDGGLAARTPRLVAEGPHLRLPAARRRSRAIMVSQADVRAIQLAKAALHAGAKLLDGPARRRRRSTG